MNAPATFPVDALPLTWAERISIARRDPSQGKRMIGSIAEEAARKPDDSEYVYSANYYLDATDDEWRSEALDELEALIEADNAPYPREDDYSTDRSFERPSAAIFGGLF